MINGKFLAYYRGLTALGVLVLVLALLIPLPALLLDILATQKVVLWKLLNNTHRIYLRKNRMNYNICSIIMYYDMLNTTPGTP